LKRLGISSDQEAENNNTDLLNLFTSEEVNLKGILLKFKEIKGKTFLNLTKIENKV